MGLASSTSAPVQQANISLWMAAQPSIAPFSTGINHGDGYQASHWAPFSGVGIMQPTASQGQLLSITPTDIRAFDAIGWDRWRPSLQPLPRAFWG